MLDAGLLKSKQQLTNVELQSNIAKTLSATMSEEESIAKSKELMASMGLTVAKEGENAQTVKLTKTKLAELIASDQLTQAQAQEIAARTGVLIATQSQNAITPVWIANLKAMAIATWEQVKATAAWLVSTPAGWATIAIGSIVAVTAGIWKLHDALTITLEEQKEKLKESKEAYEDVKNELHGLETEIQNNIDRIKELEALPNLTWIEQEELDQLREATKELELQKQLKQDDALQAAEDLYQESKKTIEKEFIISDSSSVEDVKQELSSGRISVAQLGLNSNPDDITNLLATFQYLNEEKENLTDVSEIEKYDLFIDSITNSIREKLSSLSEYKQNILDIASVRDLTEEEQATYDHLTSMQKMIYEFYSPATWNNLEFDSILDTKGLEKTKEELIAMAKAGELSPETLQAFPKLSAAIKDSELIVEEGSNAFTAFYNELVALADKQQEIVTDTTKRSFTDTISQVQSLSTGLEKLGKIYTDVKNKETFDWSSILNNEEFANTFSSMGSTYDNFIKTVSNAPDDIEACQEAFDTLATSYIYNTKDASGNNVMDNLTESTKDATVAMLEQMGVVNALEVVEAELAKKEEILEVQRRYASEHATELIDATYKQANAYITEADCSEISKKYLAQLYLQKNLFNGTEISTADDCENLIQLAKTAGYSTSVITRLEKLKQMFADNPLMSNVVREDINRAIKNIFSESQADIEGIDFELEFEGSKAATSASSALKSFTDLLDKELDMLDWKMEAGYTDFNDYIHDRLALIENYYQQGRLSADEYYSYLEQHYDKQLSYMDKAINAVTRRIDKEIDGLEAQKDEIEQNYQLQIDYLNEQKTLLEEANKERQRQINLQKAQYELERAKNQRTMLIYSEERGLHYVADDTAMKDAQQEVEDAEFDIQIADIESSISKLEEARDTETAAIDAMIEKLQEYKEQWTDISSAYEEEQENLIAAQIFGQEWESEILDGRLDTLNRFKDDYIAIQQAMADAAYQAAQAIANGEKTTIEDTSKGKTGSSTDEPEHGWAVVDESDPTKQKKFGKTKEQKAKAEAYLRAENKKRAASIGIDVSKDDPNDPNPEWLRLFKNSNVPGFYMKKYHTGLQQGPVKQHSFDENFKLIRRVGLGAEEVPAILKVGEAVATPEQIHNLADSIRQSAMPNLLISPSSNYPFAQNIDHITSSPTQQVINQNITLNCPNVTNHSGVEYIQRELGHLSLRALQESRKR